MTYDMAIQAINWLIDNKRWKNEHGFPDEKVNLVFFGGEPTLLWDELIVPTVQYANQQYKDEIHFGITTNGTLLSEERVKFLSDNNFNLLLSIDGAPETQNYNRPCHNSKQNSFDLVIQNIPYILKYFPNTTFRSTIDESTVSHTFENYMFAQYLGFNNIFMMPNGRTTWEQKNLDILEQEFEKIYVYMTYCFEQNKMPISFSEINKSFERVKNNQEFLLTHRRPFRSIYRCGLGTGMGAIGFDGKIYGCQEQNSYQDNSHFLLGDIFNGIDTDKHIKLLSEYAEVEKLSCGEHPEYCIDCPLQNICSTQNCPSSSYDLFHTFGKDNYVHCYWYRIMNKYAEKILLYLQNNILFQQYLIDFCNFKHLRMEE